MALRFKAWVTRRMVVPLHKAGDTKEVAGVNQTVNCLRRPLCLSCTWPAAPRAVRQWVFLLCQSDFLSFTRRGSHGVRARHHDLSSIKWPLYGFCLQMLSHSERLGLQCVKLGGGEARFSPSSTCVPTRGSCRGLSPSVLLEPSVLLHSCAVRVRGFRHSSILLQQW